MTAPKKAVEAEPAELEKPAAGDLTTKYGHREEPRPYGESHHYSFSDGTGAKVWAQASAEPGHWAVGMIDRNGRIKSSAMSAGVATEDVNTMLDEAAAKADQIMKNEAAAAEKG